MRMTKHDSHPAIVKRLRRAEGHIRSIISMIEEERSCVDLAQQLHAVEAAIGNAKRELIQDHIEHCLDDTTGRSAKTALQEFKSLTKYL
jgi:DNA-binding FrmR family transcriptional regulator